MGALARILTPVSVQPWMNWNLGVLMINTLWHTINALHARCARSCVLSRPEAEFRSVFFYCVRAYVVAVRHAEKVVGSHLVIACIPYINVLRCNRQACSCFYER